MRPSLIINFHGIGQPVRPLENGEGPYWITRGRFVAILDIIESWPGDGELAVTFDDGNESDFAIAAPLLGARGLKAAFFVLASKLGQPGFLSPEQVTELDAAGHEIGSHGLDHLPWTSLENDELHAETFSSREILEDLLSKPVISVALPFGRYNRRVLRAVRKAGYRYIYSSDGTCRLTHRSPIPRLSIRSDLSLSTVRAAMERAPDLLRRTSQELRVLAKSVR
jgi:peptidoglycan/xylan/chitin deacetylase (PgdA/CDA1 family)